jgi:hypothetical protein
MTEVSEFRPFTPNEQFGSLRNRIEDYRLVRLIKRFDAENKQNFLNLSRTKQEVQCSVQKINVSTGHYSIKPIIELLPNLMLIGKNFFLILNSKRESILFADFYFFIYVSNFFVKVIKREIKQKEK